MTPFPRFKQGPAKAPKATAGVFKSEQAVGIDAAQAACKGLLRFHVGLTADHDALGLRRTCAVHGFGEVAPVSYTHLRRLTKASILSF